MRGNISIKNRMSTYLKLNYNNLDLVLIMKSVLHLVIIYENGNLYLIFSLYIEDAYVSIYVI